MMNKTKKLSTAAYVNRMVFLGHALLCAIILVAYLLEFFKGARSIAYTTLIALMCIVPIVVEFVMLRKDPESVAARHVISFTYGALYIFVMFTTNSVLPFTYIFPMYILVTLYSDVPTCVRIAVTATLGNIASVVYLFATKGFEASEIPDVEIRVLVSILLAVYMITATIMNKQINADKLNTINDEKQKSDQLAQDTISIANSMITQIEETHSKMEQIAQSMNMIHESMGEVSMGSGETAESVQEQLQQTESIQQQISAVKQTAQNIEKSMTDATKLIAEGGARMDALSATVDDSMKANEIVIKQMDELKEYTNKMNTIIETITSIANSTGMLALNASIEAARAGEAGKGFAVVAGEISALANQTKGATVNITELIGQINEELGDVVDAIGTVTQSNKENEESTKLVKESFEGISKENNSIMQQTNELSMVVDTLAQANNEIVDKIQTISAITEEVSAHASETYTSCEENSNLIASVSGIVENLSENAKNLQTNDAKRHN